ncbi:hypothetical protein C7H84_00835 [Burkholderia sp. Nafp2/4-1b]|nr:hypothetical protein C7H84_00835 [Burkholderia sp. Nafp2/4-1b]
MGDACANLLHRGAERGEAPGVAGEKCIELRARHRMHQRDAADTDAERAPVADIHVENFRRVIARTAVDADRIERVARGQEYRFAEAAAQCVQMR